MRNDEIVFEDMNWQRADVGENGVSLDVRGVDIGEVLDASVRGDPSPWWAHVWPAGIALAKRILAGPRLDGVECLDLGAGSGIVGIALGRMGAKVTFADNVPKALELARVNAERSGLRGFELLEMDWTSPLARRWAQVYAADVLYEQDHIVTVIGAFRALMASDGVGRLADPKRQPLTRFFSAAKDADLEITVEEEPQILITLRHARREPASDGAVTPRSPTVAMPVRHNAGPPR